MPPSPPRPEFFVERRLGRVVVAGALRARGFLVHTMDDGENLPPPEVLAAEIVEDLEAALAEFAEIARTLAQPRE